MTTALDSGHDIEATTPVANDVTPESPDGQAVGDAVSAAVDPGAPGFAVHLDNFEGPFDLLLQLISKHKLDITEVALSRVTDEFIAYIKAMGSAWELEQTTQFLVVASTLLDLKIVRLLPSAEIEDEDDLAQLEARDLLFARLLQYRAFKQVASLIETRMADESRRVPAPVGLDERFASVLPDVLITIGPEEFARLAGEALAPKERADARPGPPACSPGQRARPGGHDRRAAPAYTHDDVPRPGRGLAGPSHHRGALPRPARAVPRGRRRLRAGHPARRAEHPLDRQRRGLHRGGRRVRQRRLRRA